jgi:fucose 4-O-acetylase-like acetyltransferase
MPDVAKGAAAPSSPQAGPDAGDWILIGKGIGIILVVAGHFFPDGSPYYWAEGRAVVYGFHMPLFFLLSGYLYVHDKYPYGQLILNKVKRLLYPFATVALTYFLIKYLAGLAAHLDHPVDLESVYALILDPVKSFVPLLWFVHALFIIFVVYPLARRFLGATTLLLLLVAINVLFGSKFPVIGKALAHIPYFALGVLLRERPRLFAFAIGPSLKHLLSAAALFAAGCLLALPGTDGFPTNYLVQVFLAVTGTLLVLDSSVALALHGDARVPRALAALGYYSMTIYLFHTLFESSVRVAFLRIAPHAAGAFPVVALSAIVIGIIVPVILEKYLLRRWRPTRKFVLGMS